MITQEVIERCYKENYELKNRKKGRHLNIPEKLFKDYHKFCIDMSESMSKRIRLFMVRELIENKRFK